MTPSGRRVSPALQIDSLTMDQWEAQKNRFRKVSDGGVELAVSLDRGNVLARWRHLALG